MTKLANKTKTFLERLMVSKQPRVALGRARPSSAFKAQKMAYYNEKARQEVGFW